MPEDKTEPEWFTPTLKYLSMKKELMGEFPDKESFGEFGTEKQIIALSSLVEYFKKTRNLADQFTHLSSDIVLDNKNLVVGRVLPLLNKLYEQLLLAVVEGAEAQYPSLWDQPSSVTLTLIENFLVKMRSGCLTAYESKVWSEVNCFDHHDNNCEDTSEVSDTTFVDYQKRFMSKDKADLRRLGNKVYARLEDSQRVRGTLRKYQHLTQKFVDRYASELSEAEAELLKRKVRIARNAAKSSRFKDRKSSNTPSKMEIETIVEVKEVTIVKLEEDAIELVGELDDETKCVEDCKVLDRSMENLYVDQVSHTPPDQTILLLPDVPQDLDHHSSDLSENTNVDIDEQIRQRLIKLQLFSKVWAKSSENSISSLSPNLEIESSEKTEAPSEASDHFSDVEIVPLESTEQDRIAFNNWYYAKVDKHPNQPKSGTPVPVVSSVSELPMSIPNMANMVPNSDHWNIPMYHNPVERNQPELLEIISNLCLMQATVVNMVMSASLIMNKLDSLLMFARSNGQDKSTNTPQSTPPPCDIHPSECYSPDLEQDKLSNTGYFKEFPVSNAPSSQCCRTVTPWKTKGVVLTKVFEMKI